MTGSSISRPSDTSGVKRYFDTAFVLKCYVREDGSDAVRALARETVQLATSEFNTSHPLRAADALHCATAAVMGLGTTYSNDRHLLQGAKAFALTAINATR